MPASTRAANAFAPSKYADRSNADTVHRSTTSDDEIHDHRCKWKDETHLTCEPLKAGLGGQPATEELSFSFEKDAAGFASTTKTAVCEPLHAGMNGEPITEDLSFDFEKGSMSFKSVVTMKDGGKMVFEGKGAK